MSSGALLTVSNTLGVGFLEKVHENALAHEIGEAGLGVAQQSRVMVQYDDVTVGDYAADLLIDDAVIIELKVVSELSDIHRAQCMNYLKASGVRLCLLINFGKPRLEVRRIIWGY